MGQEDWNPGRLLQVSGSYWETCTLHAAVEVDLFTLLGNDSLDGEEIARRLDGDLRGVSMLLNALAVMGLLSRSDGKYTNTPAARSFLSRDSERYLGHMIRHHHHLVEAWARLDQAVLSGQPIRARPPSLPRNSSRASSWACTPWPCSWLRKWSRRLIFPEGTACSILGAGRRPMRFISV